MIIRILVIIHFATKNKQLHSLLNIDLIGTTTPIISIIKYRIILIFKNTYIYFYYMFINKLFILLCFIDGVYPNSESNLRYKLFKNYNKYTRPVKNTSDNVLLKYGLEINNLVYFNQKSENIELTMKNTLSWKDQYLTWDFKQTPKIY